MQHDACMGAPDGFSCWQENCFGSDKKETLGLRDAVLKVAGLHSTFHLFVTVIVSQVDFFPPPSNLPVRAREAFRSRYLRALAAPYLCK